MSDSSPHGRAQGPFAPKADRGQRWFPELRAKSISTLVVPEPIEGLAELAGHPEFRRALVEQPGRGSQLQLEHGAGPGTAHRHSELFQWYSPTPTYSAAPDPPGTTEPERFMTPFPWPMVKREEGTGDQKLKYLVIKSV